MRLAVLSDIHGNLPALEAVLTDLERFKVDGLIVAGDYIGGPQPNETIRLLRSYQGWMIRGNSDNYVIQFDQGLAPDARRISKQWALTRWAHNHLASENIEFLKALPEQRRIEIAGAHPIRLVHGSHRSPTESIFPERDPATLEQVLMQIKEPVFICGHTHIPWKKELPRHLALNPGAVCGPLNGEVGAQYALLRWVGSLWQAELRSVPYDIERLKVAFYESGLLSQGGALAYSFLRSIETGSNIADDFLTFAYALAAKAGFSYCEVVPDVVWDEAAQTFNWKNEEKADEPPSPN